jgi:hypothetical protein
MRLRLQRRRTSLNLKRPARVALSQDLIPTTLKRGLLTVDVGQNCSNLDVAVPHKTAPTPLAKAEEGTRRFRREAIANVG